MGNEKEGLVDLTAGFTIAVGDYDNDDDFDTEWLPWLDEVDTSNCAVNENGPSCMININDVNDAVDYFKE